VGKAPARSKSAAAIAFTVTAAEIDGVIAALPLNCAPGRLKLFRFILEDWFSLDLPSHYQLAHSGADAVASGQLKAIAKQAGILDRLLKDLEGEQSMKLLIAQLASTRGLPPSKEVRAQLAIGLEVIAEVGAAASEVRPRRGHPMNNFSYWVLLDIAAMYEWLTGDKPSRITDLATERGGGPFYELCQAIWPLAHKKTPGGLVNTVKKWATAQPIFEEKSALITNFILRYRQ
jgi:hypothetical protein